MHTLHGPIRTPAFVPVATNGCLKGMAFYDVEAMQDDDKGKGKDKNEDDVEDDDDVPFISEEAAIMDRDDPGGADLVFMNSYHLLLQPGPEVIEAGGGLHKFMRRSRNRNGNGSNGSSNNGADVVASSSSSSDSSSSSSSRRQGGAIITDSGGFQVFSLQHGTVYEDLSRSTSASQTRGTTFSTTPTPPLLLSSDAAAADSDVTCRPASSELKRRRARPPPQQPASSSPSSDSSTASSSASTPSSSSSPSSSASSRSSFRPESSTVKISEEGVLFRSYRTGSPILLTPESTIRAQKSYGADIIIPLDEVPSVDVKGLALAQSVARSHRWEARSLVEHYTGVSGVSDQAIYGVVHGGMDLSLRSSSIDFVSSLPFDGYAIGGSLGSCHTDLETVLTHCLPLIRLRSDKPVHLLGLADEASIRLGVRLGVDTFDSCFPTRLARHGTLLTKRHGKVHIKNAAFVTDFGRPVEEGCRCGTCRDYDRAFLNHLFRAKEPLFLKLATEHNLFYMNGLMRDIRRDIRKGLI